MGEHERRLERMMDGLAPAWIVLRGTEVPCPPCAAWDGSWNGGESVAMDLAGCFVAREARWLQPGGVCRRRSLDPLNRHTCDTARVDM